MKTVPHSFSPMETLIRPICGTAAARPRPVFKALSGNAFVDPVPLSEDRVIVGEQAELHLVDGLRNKVLLFDTAVDHTVIPPLGMGAYPVPVRCAVADNAGKALARVASVACENPAAVKERQEALVGEGADYLKMVIATLPGSEEAGRAEALLKALRDGADDRESDVLSDPNSLEAGLYRSAGGVHSQHRNQSVLCWPQKMTTLV